MLELPRALVFLSAGLAVFTMAGLAFAQDDARTKQLQLLCAQISGDLTDPGGQVVGFQYFPDGDTLYVHAADTNLWRKSGNDNAEHVDTSVAAFQAVDIHLAYVLCKDVAECLHRACQAITMSGSVAALPFVFPRSGAAGLT